MSSNKRALPLLHHHRRADRSSDIWDYDHRRRVLPSGLTLTEIHLPHLHSGSIAVYLRTGSRFESAADNGLTHFLEHMVFRGTEHHPSAHALNLAVEKLGGTLFAATAPDSTMFEMTLPQESLVRGIELLAEIVTEPLFREIEVERRVIIEEIREDLDEQDNPIDIDFLARAKLWPDNPLGQAVTGPLTNAMRFTSDDVLRHFETHYTAANTVVCLSGAFDPQQLGPAAEHAFSRLPHGVAPLPIPSPSLGRGPTVSYAHRPGSQTNVQLSFHAPGSEDADWIAAAILLRVLDDGMSTRLHRRIFDELGLAYNVGADLEGYHDVGALALQATATHENIVTITEQLLDLVRELRDEPITDDERAKAVHRASWALETFLDDPHAMSGWFGEQTLYHPPVSLEERSRQIAGLAKTDLERVAQRIFTRENLHLTAVGVVSDADRDALERLVRRFS